MAQGPTPIKFLYFSMYRVGCRANHTASCQCISRNWAPLSSPPHWAMYQGALVDKSAQRPQKAYTMALLWFHRLADAELVDGLSAEMSWGSFPSAEQAAASACLLPAKLPTSDASASRTSQGLLCQYHKEPCILRWCIDQSISPPRRKCLLLPWPQWPKWCTAVRHRVLVSWDWVELMLQQDFGTLHRYESSEFGTLQTAGARTALQASFQPMLVAPQVMQIGALYEDELPWRRL